LTFLFAFAIAKVTHASRRFPLLQPAATRDNCHGNVKYEKRQRNSKIPLTTISHEADFKESSIEAEVESCNGNRSRSRENEQMPGKIASARSIISLRESY